MTLALAQSAPTTENSTMFGTPSTLDRLTILADEKGTPYAKLEPTTGKMYSLDETFLYKLEPMARHGDDDVRVFGDKVAQGNLKNLANYAADHENRHQRALAARDCAYGGGRQINMDLGPADVHIQSALTNYAGGYTLEDGVADLACPVIPTNKDSDKYFVWNSSNAFSRVIPNIAAAGAPPAEVSPTVANSPFQTVPYALAAAISLEVESNADAPLRPYQAAVDRLMNALRLEREYRVMNLLTTSANWNSSNVLALGSGANWNNGASSDPIANIHYMIQHSAQKITRIIAGEPVVQAMQRNQAVRSYYFAKDQAPALPSGEEISALFKIPPIVTASMKYTTGGSLNYVWQSSTLGDRDGG